MFSEEYYPQIVQFLSDQHANLHHLKFNFVLTVIYESPVPENDEDVEKTKKLTHESFRKGRYIFYFSQFFRSYCNIVLTSGLSLAILMFP